MEVQSQFGDDVRIIGIPSLGPVESMEQFVDRSGAGAIDHIPDPKGDLWERFDVRQHRTYLMVNDDGTTRTIGYGSLAEDVAALVAR